MVRPVPVSRARVTAAFLSLVAALAASAGAQVPQVPRFEAGLCPFEGGEWLEEERIVCGTLFVAESRDREESRALRLAVAILRSPAADPSPDPVVFLQGGPGGATVRFAERITRSPLWSAIRERRDLVIWDQRGTGYSDPSFCPDLGMDLSAGDLQAMAPDARVRRERRLLAACRERVLAEGLDFSAYNSVASAQDLEDLRVALGYDRWNLFGASYGTRLALIAARDHPAGIRSMILDAVSPTDIGGDSTQRSLLHSLGLVFRQCEADQACDALFPDLEGEFWGAIEELNAEPFLVPMADTARFRGGTLEVDGRMLALGLFRGLYLAEFIPLAPHAIRQIRARNATLVRALAADLAPDPEIENRWLQYAVECYEQEPLLAEVTATETARSTSLPDLSAPALPAVCDAWHGERADTTLLRRPIRADIPTLVASGEFDPVTPPRNGRHVAAALPRARHIEVRGAGHGALGTECPRTIMLAFIDEPDGILDTGCLDERPGVRFVTDLRIAPRFSAAALSLAEGPSTAVILWVGATLLVLASGPVIWPIAALIRRLRRRAAPPRAAGGVVARTLAVLTALCVMGFVVGLALVLRNVAATNPFILGFGLPGEAVPLLTVPWVVMVFGAGTAACAVLAWRRGWWSRAACVHYSLVATAAISFVGVLFAFGLF